MNRRFIGIRVLLFAVGLLIVIGLSRPVSAAARPVIHDFTEFYEQFARQIHDREALRYYDVPDKNLAKKIVHQNLDGFAAHYDEKQPLLSGCYLVYYIQTVYFTYDANGLKVMIEFPYNGGEMDAHFQMMAQLAVQLKQDTDYDTVQNVHDYLIENFEYDHNTEMANHTDIDGFRDKRMVCSGYSLATYYLLNSAGIETRVITGYGGEKDERDTNHMWNMVKLDGKWYNLDVTWDDEGGSRKSYLYFLKSDDEFPMHVRTGTYDTATFRNMVSRESYPLPFMLRVKNMNLNRVFYAVIILVCVVLMIIRFRRNVKANAQPNAYRNVYPPQDSNGGYPWNGPNGGNSWNGPNGGNSWNGPNGGNSWNGTNNGNLWNGPNSGNPWIGQDNGSQWNDQSGGDPWQNRTSVGQIGSPESVQEPDEKNGGSLS